MAMMMNNSN